MTIDGRFPYPGLRAYHRDESDLFFGREGCINNMVERLAATRFLAVLGASGSGKSSLVRTGLLDALELGFHSKAGSRWLISDIQPGGQPMQNLALGLLRASGNADPEALDLSVLDSFLRRGPLSVAEWCRDGNVLKGWNLLLLIDQFEELFRYSDYAGREEAEAFVALLLESANSDVPIHVVITMRSEYLGACALLPGLAERINTGLYLTRRMTREECREAIVGPAGVMGFGIEPTLVNRLLNDLSSFAPWEGDEKASQLQQLSRRADQLPIMQHVLSRLWQRAAQSTDNARPTLRLADYEAVGELQGAFGAHAAEVMERLSPPASAIVSKVFRALVTGTTISDAVRRPRRFADLTGIVAAEPAIVKEVVDAFRAPDCNFLRPPLADPIHEDTIIDISHESLIRQWSSLAGWLAEEARATSLWQRLASAQASFERGESDLLSGLDLANIVEWWEKETPNIFWARDLAGDYASISAFLLKSKQAEEQRRQIEEAAAKRERRRLRTRAAAYGVLAILAIFAGSVALWEARISQQESARAEQSLATARAVVSSMTALLFAPDIGPTPDVTPVYREAFDAIRNSADKFPDVPAFNLAAGLSASVLAGLYEKEADEIARTLTREKGKVLTADSTTEGASPEQKRSEERRADAKKLAQVSINYLDLSLDDTSEFSERFRMICQSYGTRARLLYSEATANGLSDAKKYEYAREYIKAFDAVRRKCGAVLDKYPFDFYLRSYLDTGYANAGELLFNAKQYQEALPYLEHGANNGQESSTTLLARMYEGGLGVQQSEERTAELTKKAHTQSTKITIPVDFESSKNIPFDFYIIDRPNDFPYKGIDDQVEWVKKARRGNVPDDVVESFRKLQQIAWDKNIPFPVLARERQQVSVDVTGVAIRGYDPVAYFTQKKPVPGEIMHRAFWRGASWLFSTAENKDKFTANPEGYMPAFGGHCAFCVASGHKLHSDPTAWVIYKGRLYLHATEEYRAEWKKMPNEYIKLAEEKWPSLRDKEIVPQTSSRSTTVLGNAKSDPKHSR